MYRCFRCGEVFLSYRLTLSLNSEAVRARVELCVPSDRSSRMAMKLMDRRFPCGDRFVSHRLSQPVEVGKPSVQMLHNERPLLLRHREEPRSSTQPPGFFDVPQEWHSDSGTAKNDVVPPSPLVLFCAPGVARGPSVGTNKVRHHSHHAKSV